MLIRRVTLFLFILLSIIIVPSSIINAQGTIKGKIVDQKGEALTGANVFLIGTTLGAATDLNGMYVIKQIPAGTYNLKVSMVGYKSLEFKVEVKDKETLTKDVALAEDILYFESVVVTGTAGGSGIKKKDASFSITTISPRDIERLGPPSTAAALDLVPGVWSESSGGVAGANIFVRGLPSSGDAPFVTMSINGAPIYGTQTLSFFEQSSIFRIDETVGFIEALRGGPSSVFSNGESGLTTNFNLLKGTDQTKGKVKYSTSDYSKQRIDAVLSGPISERFYYMVGGYARTSPGIRNTEFNSEEGGQFTVQLTKVFDKGVVNGFARVTNDHGQWVLPMALATGNNLGTFSPLGNATRFRTLRINAQGDSAHYDFSKGRGWKGIISGLNFDYGLGGGWTVRDNFSYTSGQANTYGFVPNGSPMEVSDLTAKLGTSSIKTVGGKTLTSGYVQSYGHWVVEKQLESIINDISLTNELGKHKVTFGAYQSFWSSEDFWTLGNQILVQNVTNGDVIKDVSPDSVAGSWNYGLNEAGDSRMFAVYAGDSWQITDKIRLDVGARYDFFNLNFTLDHGAFPDGTIDKIANLDGKDWAGTGAINYAVNNNLGVFIRGSKGSLFPNFDQIRDGDLYHLTSGDVIRDANGNVSSVKGTVEPNIFNQFELGVKIEQGLYSLFITGFLNTVEIYDGDIGATRIAALLKTRTVGAEVDAGLSLGSFKVNLIGTFLNGKITGSEKAPETVGNKIWRQPDVQLRLAPSYNFQLSKSVSAAIYGAIRYVGKRWNDRDNSYQLDSYSKLDLGLDVSTSGGLTFNLSGNNLTDSHGLTEGDPRDPTSKNGRPIFGRSIRFSIGVNF
ncbi:TonB-dependent Receptor Plug Domain protein [bacterium BMS3Abin03]|nr:TonB-dependent Receptor Plug Domain protein [bacterium BMS3Abin03]